MIVSESLTLVLVIFIGIRSIDSISDRTKYFSTSFCVFIIWAVELVIVVRYVLAILSHHRLEEISVTSESPMRVVVPVNESHDHQLVSQKRDEPEARIVVTEIESVMSHEKFASIRGLKINSIKEIEENDEDSQIGMPETVLPVVPMQTRFFPPSSASNINEFVIKRRSFVNSEIDKKIEKKSGIPPFRDREEKFSENQEGSSNNILASTRFNDTSVNASSRHEARENQSNILEEVKIQEFLRKVDNSKVKFGNKGLGLD